MAKRMKLLIAYDGSTCADEAITDLQRMGLPDDVEAIVLSVADTWILPAANSKAPTPMGSSLALREARASVEAMVEKAKQNAATATERVQQLFHNWHIHTETATDSPAWAIVQKAEDNDIDLIVVGSHGYSAWDRLMIGSVSQSVLTHAPCSVRIVRGRNTPSGKPLRILCAIDGSAESELAVQTIANRKWPAGTDIHLVIVVDNSILESLINESGSTTEMPNTTTYTAESKINSMLENFAATIKQGQPESTVSTSIMTGDPKRVLVEVAENWGADCIFIGSRGLNQWQKLLIGSVSSAVTTRAHCPVEVVRHKAII